MRMIGIMLLGGLAMIGFVVGLLAAMIVAVEAFGPGPVIVTLIGIAIFSAGAHIAYDCATRED